MRRDSFLYRFRFDLLILGILLLIGIGAWFNHSPITLEHTEEEMVGIAPPSVGRSDVLLLLPTPPTEHGATFSDLDFSLAWYNTLAQEVGPFLAEPATTLSEGMLTGIHLVVVPATTAAQMEPEGITLLTGYAMGGGSIIIELPGPRWAPITGIRHAVTLGRWGKRITAAEDSPLQGDFQAKLLDTPLQTRLLRLDASDFGADNPADILMEIDGTPAHIHRRVGQGHAFIVSFDYGMTLTALQQGLPEPDLSISVPETGEEDAEDIPFTTPDQLVASPKLTQSTVPYADLLERHILYSTLRYYPSARLWLYPETQLGALVLTHEEGGMGDIALYMAEYEHEIGWSSTYFVSPTEISNDGLDALHAYGSSVGLAWHRGPEDAIYKTRGIGRLQPMRRPLSLIDQLERLEGWSGRRIHSVRVRQQIWDREYTSTFRKMGAAGVGIDSSYGPVSAPQHGYLFGTGLPFYPIDTNGLLLPLYEMPFVLSDSAVFTADDKDLMSKLIKESRSGFHQLITLDIDADTMRRNPHADTLQTWIQSFEVARREHHWITHLEEYIRFYEGRRKSTIRSHFSRSSRVLEVEVELPGVLARSGDANLPAPAIAVPMRYQGAAIDKVTVNEQEIEQSQMARTGDGVLALIPVRPGLHSIMVEYSGGP